MKVTDTGTKQGAKAGAESLSDLEIKDAQLIFEAVWQEAMTHKCSLRTAAYMIAIRRVQAASELAGHQ